MRSLEARIVVLFALLLLAIQFGAMVITHMTVANDTRARLADKLMADERVHSRLLDLDRVRLTQSAHVLVENAAFVDAVLRHDTAATARILGRQDTLAGSQIAMVVGIDRRVEADVLPDSMVGQPFPLPGIIDAAETTSEADGIVALHGGLYQIVVMPIETPARGAWLVLGFSIDDEDTRLLHDLVGLDVSYLVHADAGWRITTTTLPPDVASSLIARLDRSPMAAQSDPVTWEVEDDAYLTMVVPLQSYGGRPAVSVIQRSLRDDLRPLHKLQRTLLEFTALAMLIAILCCIWVARGIVRPVKALATFARRIAGGEYGQPLHIERADEIGDLVDAFGQMHDGITERENRILDLAYRDALTGLPNRTLLTDRLGQALETSRRVDRPVALLLIDLDRFKEVNDLLGHRGGDALLIEFAERLKAVFKRTSDTIARMGGDEFAVLMPTGSTAEALLLVESLMRNLEAPIPFEGHLVDIRASIGVAVFPEHGDDLASFARNAESAMHVAKRDKCGHALYDPQIERLSVERLSLMSELRRAVEEDQFVLFFQPKREMRDSAALLVEALVRWEHPVRGLLGPDAFIPFAEQTGVISIVTEWVIRAALAQCREWRIAGLDPRVAINISTRDLIATSFPAMVGALLEKFGHPPYALTLEITETAILGDPEAALANMQRLHKLGCRLSIDDFGTGYSSLAYLKRLPVHELKIDRSFVMNMAADSSDAVIVRSTIDLGHNMGLQVVAEGVETLEVLNQLREMGCDVAQGYLIGRPLNAIALGRWAGNERLSLVRATGRGRVRGLKRRRVVRAAGCSSPRTSSRRPTWDRRPPRCS